MVTSPGAGGDGAEPHDSSLEKKARTSSSSSSPAAAQPHQRKRCDVSGCPKGAVTLGRCVAHGGGRRCGEPGCSKAGVGPLVRCIAHGGGR